MRADEQARESRPGPTIFSSPGVPEYQKLNQPIFAAETQGDFPNFSQMISTKFYGPDDFKSGLAVVHDEKKVFFCEKLTKFC